MFKIQMTFLVPEDKIKFKKCALVVNENDPSDEFYSSGKGFSGKEVPEGKTFVRTDLYPDIPEVINGTVYNNLTEKQQEAFWLVEGEYLFEHEYSQEITDEFLLARSCST